MLGTVPLLCPFPLFLSGHFCKLFQGMTPATSPLCSGPPTLPSVRLCQPAWGYPSGFPQNTQLRVPRLSVACLFSGGRLGTKLIFVALALTQSHTVVLEHP